MKSAPLKFQTSDFSIRPAADANDCRHSEQLQLQIWGCPEIEVVPVHMLRALSSEGLVMNAYDKSSRPIGTSFAFLAKHDGKLILYSHFTGVVPEFQGKGVGLALKLMQRRYAIKQGLDLVCWTYDPMQSLNNWFNLSKLGAIARTYYVNYYGSMQDELNRGLESDRFLAEWWVKSRRVKRMVNSGRPLAPDEVQSRSIVNPTIVKEGVRLSNGQFVSRSTEKTILIEIPHEYTDLRRLDPSMLQQWRVETRRSYTHYLKRGYIATGAFVCQSDGKRSFVRLEKEPLRRILLN